MNVRSFYDSTLTRTNCGRTDCFVKPPCRNARDSLTVWVREIHEIHEISAGSTKANARPRVIQVQDRGYRENAANRAAGHRPRDLADGQELVGDLQREQEVHEEAVHGLEASDTPHTGRQHPGRQDAVERDLRVVDDDVVLHFLDDDGRAEPAGAGAVRVEEAGIDLQRPEGQGELLLSFRSIESSESRESGSPVADGIFR